MLINLLSSYPKTKRIIKSRLIDKDHNRKIALKFDREYFDGKRCYGYGGYKYDGRWIPIAKKIIHHYGLKPKSKILDIGCAKGFLVYDLMKCCKGLDVYGIDISTYAIKNCMKDVAGRLHVGNASNLPFPDNTFDLVLSINTLHNLSKKKCIEGLKEIERVTKNSRAFVQVDSYNNINEKKLFIDWMLTAKTYGPPRFWEKLFQQSGYQGDYFWTFI